MSKNKIDELRKALPERERRMVSAGDLPSVSLRSAEGEPPKIAMTLPYDRDSVQMMGFTERVAPGAFTRSIKNGRGSKRSDVVALWNHDPNWVLGRQANGSLEFEDSEKALEGVVTLDGEDAMHRHFARRVERRDVQGSSFGFEVVKDEWDYKDDEITRTLVEVKMFDISPVTYPAYPDSGAEQRSLVDVAAVKAGVDLSELAGLLRGATAGKVAMEKRESLTVWVAKLEAFLPPAPKVEIDWAARLAARAKRVIG